MKKRYWLLVIILCFSQSLHAQFLNTGGGIDKEHFNFGFLLGVDRNYFRVTHQPGFTQPGSNPYTPNDTLSSIKPLSVIGFSMGIVTNFKLGTYFDLRFLPTFSFANKDLKYTYNANSEPISYTKKVESTLIELPLLLKFKSARYHDMRLYVVGGMQYSFDIRSDKKKPSDDIYGPEDERTLVKINDAYASWVFGVGCDIYLTYFKFSPEIKFSRSLQNVLSNQGENRFTQPLSGLYPQTFSLTFYFE